MGRIRLDDVDAEIVVKGCQPGVGKRVYATVASLIRSGAYRFALRLEGSRLEDCLDELRDAIQGFIASSFLVVEGDYPVNARTRVELG